MKLELIENIEPRSWNDAISDYDVKCLFHQSQWLNFLEETQAGKTIRLRILDNGKIAGHFAGLLIRKGPLKILGSPLPGWTTNYMGPIVNHGFDLERFLLALDDLCRNLGIHHVELCSPFLNRDIMSRRGFSVSEGMTFIVPLSFDEEQMWKNLRSNCRNRIRKAVTYGLIVEDSHSSAFVDEYYAQLKEVFARQKLVPTYAADRVRSLFHRLKPDFLFSLAVKYKNTTIATGLFPHDDRCVYFFGGASWKRYQYLCPNELLHWTAMCRAAQLGIPKYNMCGGGSFKPKFGGEMKAIHSFQKSYSNFVKLGREAYKTIFFINQKLRAKVHKTVQSIDQKPA